MYSWMGTRPVILNKKIEKWPILPNDVAGELGLPKELFRQRIGWDRARKQGQKAGKLAPRSHSAA